LRRLLSRGALDANAPKAIPHGIPRLVARIATAVCVERV